MRFLEAATPDIESLLKAAIAKFDGMSRAERSAMLMAQRRSWVIGELMLEDENLTQEEASRRYDAACGL